MRCPKCDRPGAERYGGEQAHKLNTAFCGVCGRVALPPAPPAPQEEPTTAVEVAPAEEPEVRADSSARDHRRR